MLAYAALPTNGDMYFDDTEKWAEFHQIRPFSMYTLIDKESDIALQKALKQFIYYLLVY